MTTAAIAAFVVSGLDTTQTPPWNERSWALFVSSRKIGCGAPLVRAIRGSALTGPAEFCCLHSLGELKSGVSIRLAGATFN